MKKSKATEALRVATDIAAIKTALHKRGYRLRKQPKQPVWKVIITPEIFYTLTYQPAPISAWVLHPQNNDTRRHTLETIIHSKRPKKATRKQLAKYLKIDPTRVWRWEKWKHVLWVHIQGMGGYFISYRQLEQWVAACCTLIRACRDWKALKLVWSAIEREAARYTEEAFNRLVEIHAQRLSYLLRPKTG